MKRILLIITCAALAGCASVGSKLDTAKINQIKPGTTTKAELLGWFGPPISQGLDTSGKSTVMWHYAEVHTAPFWSEMKTQTLSVILNTNDVVEKFVVSDQFAPDKKP